MRPRTRKSSPRISVQRAVDLVALGEEAVAADIEAVALVLLGPADAADADRVGLKDDAGHAVAGQLVGGGQAGGAGAGDDGRIGGDHARVGTAPLNPLPAMRPGHGARGLGSRRVRPHDALLPVHGWAGVWGSRCLDSHHARHAGRLIAGVLSQLRRAVKPDPNGLLQAWTDGMIDACGG